MPQLPAPLRAFADAPPEVADPRALEDTGMDALEALVAQLAEAGARAHLEVLARSKAIPKGPRKAAGKAAYRLKSAGVGASAAPRDGLSVAAEVSLDDRVHAIPPGPFSCYTIVTAALPDARAWMCHRAEPSAPITLSTFDQLTPGALRRRHRELDAEEQRSIVGHAALALRLADHVAADLRDADEPFPDGWSQVLWWCDKAGERGADPRDADARRRLEGAVAEADVPRALEDEGLFEHAMIGTVIPPRAALEALEAMAGDVIGTDEDLTRDDVVQRLEGIADTVCTRFFSDRRQAARTARSLEATADVLAAAEMTDDAVTCLVLADALREGTHLPHELGLLRAAFRRRFDVDAVWSMYREARA